MAGHLMPTMPALRHAAVSLLALFAAPLGLHAAWWLSTDAALAWSQADWSSAHLLPPARAKPEALVHIYAARTGRWKGIFAHHTWIVVKDRDAGAYTRYDKVAWGAPIKTNNWAPDARWYGHRPILIGAVEGPAAETLIPKIRAAVARYPYSHYGDYSVWPGPNSNSFTAYILGAVPEAQIALPPTAIGKDWRVDRSFLGLTPSRTGIQLSVNGLFGVTVGWVEGVEVNLLGLVAGVDLRRPALKLPGLGRIGFAAVA
jgi:Protein of unknown function (DUF3750)